MKNGLIISDNVGKYWYLNDELHREDGPAIEYKDGQEEWWYHNKRHREGGPAVKYKNGDVSWYQHGKRHRVDGPAKEWFLDEIVEWWYQDQKIDCNSQEEFERLINLKTFW